MPVSPTTEKDSLVQVSLPAPRSFDILPRAVDPHSFFAAQDPAVFNNVDPDPDQHVNPVSKTM